VTGSVVIADGSVFLWYTPAATLPTIASTRMTTQPIPIQKSAPLITTSLETGTKLVVFIDKEVVVGAAVLHCVWRRNTTKAAPAFAVPAQCAPTTSSDTPFPSKSSIAHMLLPKYPCCSKLVNELSPPKEADIFCAPYLQEQPMRNSRQKDIPGESNNEVKAITWTLPSLFRKRI
jgi:hypothetical protein